MPRIVEGVERYVRYCPCLSVRECKFSLWVLGRPYRWANREPLPQILSAIDLGSIFRTADSSCCSFSSNEW